MNSKSQMIQVLKGLLVVCRASERGFRAAANAITSRTTRRILHEYADQRKDFADQLRVEIRFHSGNWPNVEPPVHSLVNLDEAENSRNKKEIIGHCERSEEAMMRVYEDALSRKTPWDVFSVLSKQYEEIKEAYYFLTALEQINGSFAA